MNTLDLTLLAAIPALAIVCAVVIRLWIPRRRVGNAPHCRRCDYGLPSDDARRCPECGGLRPVRGHARGRRRPARTLKALSWLLVRTAAHMRDRARPRPQRILLLDRAGGVVEELEIPEDHAWTHSP